VLIRDNNGETALHHACRKDHRQIAQILLESNPDLMSIKDKTRKIALYYMSESMIKDPQLDTIIQDFISNNHSLESSLGKRGNSFDSSSFDSIPEK
jgi:ankyrin repeat protein